MAMTSAADLHRELRRRRRGTESAVEQVSIWGGGALSTVAVALWVLSGRGTGFTLDPVLSASASTSVGIVLAAAALHVLRVVGPIGTDAATTHWLVSAPLDRRTLLRGQVLAWTGALVALGVLVARLLALVAGATSWWPLAAVGAAAGALVVALAVLGQQSRRWSSALPMIELGTVVSAGVATLAPPPPAVACATVLAVAAVIGWWAADSRLGRIRRTSLTSGADLLAAGSAGLSFLDVGFLVSALETRAHRRRGAVRPRGRAGRSVGPVRALVRSDLMRHRRNTMLPAVLVTGLGLVLAASAVSMPYWAGVVGLLVGYVATSAASIGFRDMLADRSLRFSLALPDRTMAGAFLVVPSLVALTVAVTVAAAVSWWAGIVVGSTTLIAVVRSRTAPPRVYDGLAVVTMFGTVPVDVIRQVLRGPGLLLVGAVLLLL
ncbi:hypothetical protein HQ314_13695 [Rhodococcus sp. BP-332]|uniref:DUF6297 family protein n=1 Tax=Rhodococcus sp. BP-332 TaxID=2739447 RepID=UPI001C9AF4A7|nr:DUF6297 family protein [Rhodococcus sp. BP-332]MBY6677974.1 hypothetical protein [Rhodococcus sp. BP-332]